MLRLGHEPVSTDAMGQTTEVVAALVTSGTAGVLVRSLVAWLNERERQRRADVTFEITSPGEQQTSLNVRRVADPKLLRQVLEPMPDRSTDSS
jgi:hypothetical protein